MRAGKYLRYSIATDDQHLELNGRIAFIAGPGELVLPTEYTLIRRVTPRRNGQSRAIKIPGRLLSRREFELKKLQNGGIKHV